MSWLLGPAPGDWIKTTKPIKVTLTDHLMGENGGIKAGTAGVITRSVGWNTLDARLDTGLFGYVTVRVKPHQVRVTRRGGGVEEHAEHAARLRWARAGVAGALIAPIAFFCIGYMLRGGSTSGLIVTLLNGAIYGTLDLITYALDKPFNAALYLIALSAAGRFAFRA